MVEFLFVDRNDTTRMFVSRYKSFSLDINETVEGAYRASPQALDETRCEVTRLEHAGVFFLTVFSKENSMRSLEHLLVVARPV